MKCWTNELSWATPTAYDRIMSCQVVALGVLIFWFVLALLLCACMCRRRGIFAGRRRRDRGDHSALLSHDPGDTYSDGDTTGGSSEEEEEDTKQVKIASA